MLILLSEFERAKKKALLFIKLLMLGFISCFIIIIILTVFYQGLIKAYYLGSLAPISQELTIIEIFWMIALLFSFFFMNTIIWYYISYDLSKKSIITLNFAEKNDVNESICYKCGIERSSDNFKKKSNQGIKLIKILNVRGYFCKECSQHYSHISLGTILLIPLLYLLCIILVIPLLSLINLSFIPESFRYLYSTIFPVFILTIFTFVVYGIKISNKISKIYGSKE